VKDGQDSTLRFKSSSPENLGRSFQSMVIILEYVIITKNRGLEEFSGSNVWKYGNGFGSGRSRREKKCMKFLLSQRELILDTRAS